MTIYVGSDNLIWLLGLKDLLSGDYIDAAEVTATVSVAGNTVWTGPLNNVAGPQTVNGATYPDGCYVGQVPASASLVAGAAYLVTIVAEYGGNTLTKEWTAAADYDGVQ